MGKRKRKATLPEFRINGLREICDGSFAFTDELPELLVVALDAELLHAGLQRGAAQAKPGSRHWAGYSPNRRRAGLRNPLAFAGFDRAGRPGEGVDDLPFRAARLAARGWAENDGPLDQVLQLAYIAGPIVIGQASMAAEGSIRWSGSSAGRASGEVADEQRNVSLRSRSGGTMRGNTCSR